ncbi:MAG: EamA family transporter [Candidatus Liptonbacteria bacterium]
MNWFWYAVLSAICAALVAIFGKMGLSRLDSTLATALRAVVMAGITILAAILLGKFKGFTWQSVTEKEWLWIVLAGVAGALSWIFYFYALKNGPAPAVAAIDRLSLLFVFVLAVLVLKDPFTWRSTAGAILVGLGAFMMSVSQESWQRAWGALVNFFK